MYFNRLGEFFLKHPHAHGSICLSDWKWVTILITSIRAGRDSQQIHTPSLRMSSTHHHNLRSTENYTPFHAPSSSSCNIYTPFHALAPSSRSNIKHAFQSYQSTSVLQRRSNSNESGSMKSGRRGLNRGKPDNPGASNLL